LAATAPELGATNDATEARAVPTVVVDLMPLSTYDELAAVCSNTAQPLEVVA
jgi:hypothetical protein